MKLKKDFRFEAAHVLSGYDGLCGNLHGHSYTGAVYIEGDASVRERMVVDFNYISDVIKDLDHAMIFSAERFRDPFEDAILQLCLDYNKKYVLIDDGRCTAEDIAKWIAHRVGFKCSVVLKETSTSEVEYNEQFI